MSEINKRPFLENQEFTPLHLAVLKNHVQIVVSLVNHGATINAKDKDGKTALEP